MLIVSLNALLFCRGINVLNQKTELQKAMEKHKDKKIAKEQEKEKQASLTPFQKALEQQAQKLEQVRSALLHRCWGINPLPPGFFFFCSFSGHNLR